MVPILLPLVTASTVPRAKVSDSPLPPFLSSCPSLPLTPLHLHTTCSFRTSCHLPGEDSLPSTRKNKPALLEARLEQPLWLAMTSSQEDNRCRGLGVCVTINISDHWLEEILDSKAECNRGVARWGHKRKAQIKQCVMLVCAAHHDNSVLAGIWPPIQAWITYPGIPLLPSFYQLTYLFKLTGLPHGRIRAEVMSTPLQTSRQTALTAPR